MRGKSILFLAVIIFPICCNSRPEAKKVAALPIGIDMKRFAALFPDSTEKAMILSCVGCTCFKDKLNELYRQDSLFVKKFVVAADFKCVHLDFDTRHIAQPEIDSISMDIYNLTLFKRESDSIVCRIVETAESPRLLEIAKKFYDLD